MIKSIVRSVAFIFLWFLAGCTNIFAPDTNADSGVVPDATQQDSSAVNDSISNKKPALIRFDYSSAEILSIKGVGGVETARLFFTVTDSSGLPVPGNYLIQFIKNGPDSGGSLVTPFDTTVGGKVECIYASGTKAGVCAITAYYMDGNLNMAACSEVVPLMVAGGPPVGSHFTLVPAKVNMPFALGAEMTVTAFLYDKYRNPARSSMVYFSATGGGITPGGQSDSIGRVQACFRLTADIPDSMRITLAAATRNGSGAEIVASTALVVSGRPVISIAHAALPADTFIVPAGTGTLLQVSVSDSRGYPLSRGTRIIMSVSGGGMLIGESDITLPDVVSGYTQFQVMVADDLSGSSYLYFEVDVESPNGNRNKGIWGKIL
jgi:hypothetical protein